MKARNSGMGRPTPAFVMWSFFVTWLLLIMVAPASGQDLFCNGRVVTAVRGSDGTRCWVDISVTIPWAAGSGSSALQFPFGIEAAMNPPATIVGIGPMSSGWISSSQKTTLPTPPMPSPSNPVTNLRFTKDPVPNASIPKWIPPNPANSSRWIPSNVAQTFRIYVNNPGSGPIGLTVYGLNGTFVTPPGVTSMDPDVWDVPRVCATLFTFPAGPSNYTATPQPAGLCTGSSAVINLTPAPPAGSTITWYYYTPTPGNPNCPMVTPPLAPWVLATASGGTTYNTNPLPSTRCYIAMINTGCFSYASSIARVNVCPYPGSIGIIATPGIGQHPWDGQLHVCGGYSGQVTLTGIDPSLCVTAIRWRINGVIQPGTGLTIPVTLPASTVCNQSHVITAQVVTACGTANPAITIIVDRSGVVPTLTSNIGPIICPKQGAVLTANPVCGRVARWEMSTNGGSTWSTIAGAGNSTTYWTNARPPGSTTLYRVWAQNFSCAPVVSAPITLTVKPILTVSIAANRICPTAVITATPNYLPVTYQWYYNGGVIGGTSQSINAVNEGFYQVKVTDVQCGTWAWSNIVTICKPRVAIASPGCVCAGQPIPLRALPIGNCTSGCTYTWTSTSGFTGTGQSVVNTSPNFGSNTFITYTVTMNCGGGCTATASVTVTRCPP